jgi:hypothetical protein
VVYQDISPQVYQNQSEPIRWAQYAAPATVQYMSVDHRRAHVLVGQNHIKNLFQTFQSFQPCLKQNQDGSVKAKFAWKFWNLSLAARPMSCRPALGQ